MPSLYRDSLPLVPDTTVNKIFNKHDKLSTGTKTRLYLLFPPLLLHALVFYNLLCNVFHVMIWIILCDTHWINNNNNNTCSETATMRQLPVRKFGSNLWKLCKHCLISLSHGETTHRLINLVKPLNIAIMYYQGHHKKLHTLSPPSAARFALNIIMVKFCSASCLSGYFNLAIPLTCVYYYDTLKCWTGHSIGTAVKNQTSHGAS